MPAAAIKNNGPVKIRITVYTAVPAGIISADVYAGNTAAGSPLVWILFDIQLITSDAIQTPSVNTSGMLHPQSAQIRLDRKSVV